MDVTAATRGGVGNVSVPTVCTVIVKRPVTAALPVVPIAGVGTGVPRRGPTACVGAFAPQAQVTQVSGCRWC